MLLVEDGDCACAVGVCAAKLRFRSVSKGSQKGSQKVEHGVDVVVVFVVVVVGNDDIRPYQT